MKAKDLNSWMIYYIYADHNIKLAVPHTKSSNKTVYVKKNEIIIYNYYILQTYKMLIGNT